MNFNKDMMEYDKLYIECLQKAASEFEAKGNLKRAFDYLKTINKLEGMSKELITTAERWQNDIGRIEFYFNRFDFAAMSFALKDLLLSLDNKPREHFKQNAEFAKNLQQVADFIQYLGVRQMVNVHQAQRDIAQIERYIETLKPLITEVQTSLF